MAIKHIRVLRRGYNVVIMYLPAVSRAFVLTQKVAHTHTRKDRIDSKYNNINERLFSENLGGKFPLD